MTFETIAEDVVPEVRAARWGVQFALGLLAVAVVVFLWWWFVGRPAADVRKAVRATATATEARGDAAKAADAQHVVIDVTSHTAAIDAQTKSNADAIQSAPGASVAAPAAVDAAGRRALCLRPTYRHQPACIAMLGADPG